MDNHIATTILHQAITSKGNTDERAAVISTILRNTPKAAQIKNGYGSLPLHVIAQRNTKINAATKERLIHELIKAHAGALLESGGVGKRTPLHIIFTDYVSPDLTKVMIEKGSRACFMPDKKGYLPAHVACSRHCSPEKLRMLLEVNPQALFDKTNKGETVLDLATKTATKSHPNYALIEELNRQISSQGGVNTVSSEDDSEGTAPRRPRSESTESIPKAWQNLEPTPYNPRHEAATFMTVNPPPALVAPPAYHHHPTPIAYHPHHHHQQNHYVNNTSIVTDPHAPLAYSPFPMMDHYRHPPPPPPLPPSYYAPINSNAGYTTPTRKRKVEEDVDPAATLLLHFSRNSAAQTFEV